MPHAEAFYGGLVVFSVFSWFYLSLRAKYQLTLKTLEKTAAALEQVHEHHEEGEPTKHLDPDLERRALEGDTVARRQVWFHVRKLLHPVLNTLQRFDMAYVLRIQYDPMDMEYGYAENLPWNRTSHRIRQLAALDTGRSLTEEDLKPDKPFRPAQPKLQLVEK